MNHPVSVHVFDALSQQVTRTYIFVGKIPSKMFKEANIKEIESHLKKNKSVQFEGGSEYNFGNLEDFNNDIFTSAVQVKNVDLSKLIILPDDNKTLLSEQYLYPIDNYFEVKQKIAAVTGIEIYRQHLFTSLDYPFSTYTISVNESNYSYNILDIDNNTISIQDLPVDVYMYENKSSVYIENNDMFMLLGDNIKTIYVVDVFTIYKFDNINLSDHYQTELIYYGFIMKYWPYISIEQFMNNRFISVYPDINYEKENEIMSNLSSINIKDVEYIIINSEVKVDEEYEMNFNFRNLFDMLEVSHDIQTLHIKYNGYQIVKQFAITYDVDYKEELADSNQMVVYIDNNNHLVLNYKGDYSIYNNFDESEKIQFSNIDKIFLSKINPIVAKINEYSLFTTTSNKKLQIINANLDNIKYNLLNIIFYWNKIIGLDQFIEFKTALEACRGILEVSANVHADTYNIIFKKGMHKFDHSGFIKYLYRIGIKTVKEGFNNNEYEYLYNDIIWAKFMSLYGGKSVKIIHEVNRIKIACKQVSILEFSTIKYFLIYLFETYISSSKTKKENISTEKILRRLDPVLYDVKKYDENAVLYSVQCQHPRAPAMLNDEEYKLLPEKQKKNAVRFKNFTTNNMIYYLCENKNFPYISFKHSGHPLGYCMPCCQKNKIVEGTNRYKINEFCKKHFQIQDIDLNGDKKAEHILTYGKSLKPPRISYGPDILYELFILEKNKIKLIGVEQNLANIEDGGYYYSLANLAHIDLAVMIRDICKYVNLLDDNKYKMIYHGEFRNLSPVKEVISEIKHAFGEDKYSSKYKWREIITEIYQIIYNTQVVYIVDDPNSGEFFIHINKYSNPSSYSFVLKTNKGDIYPCLIDAPVASQINKILEFKNKKIDNLEHKLASKYRILNKVIDMYDYVYAYIIEVDSHKVYVPVPSAEYFKTGNELYSKPDELLNENIGKNGFKPSIALHFLAEFKYNMPIATLHHNGRCIGFMLDNYLYMYTAPHDNIMLDWPKINCPIHPIDIDKKISNGNYNKFEESFIKNVTAANYNNNLYKLFLTEFAMHIYQTRTNDVRDKIIDLIKHGQESRLADALEHYQSDLYEINYYKHKFNMYEDARERLIRAINKKNFSFDFSIMSEFTKAKLDSIMINHVIIMDIVPEEYKKINNIYASCAYKNQSQCKDGKLVISRADYNIFIDILFSDINNVIKSKYFMFATSGIIDPYQFIERQNEIIDIYI